MDPDTQRLIERTRQRREVLNQRMAGMPEAAPRKRRTPVLESDETERVLAEKQNNQDDSPKRQCFRETEQGLKADTPAIQGVQSRLKGLANLYKGEANEENVETPTPKPRKSVTSPPLERKVLKSPMKQVEPSTNFGSSRKGRFAALAEHLNNMEDDLTHHVVKKDEEKKPKWQPPKSDPAPQANAVSSGKGPAPLPPTSVAAPSQQPEPESSPKKTFATSQSKLESSPKKTFSATSQSKLESSPKKTYSATSNTKVLASPSSTLTRNSPLRTSKQCAPTTLAPSTPSTANSKQKEHDPVELSVSQRMSQMQEKLSNTPMMKRQQKDEPTAYPVGARMSAWETMTAANNVSNIKKVNPAESTPVANKQRPVTSFTPKVAETNVSLPPVPPPPPTQTSCTITPAKSFRECIEEKANKILAKKGGESSSRSPEKKSEPAYQSPSKGLSRSPSKVVHSPTKVSAGTKTFQKILAEKSQDSSTNASALAAQERASRMAELEAIQNRWKNGVLREDNGATAAVEPSQPKESDKKDSKTPEKLESENKNTTNSKREEARNKARAEFNNKLAEIGLGDGAEASNGTPQSLPSAPKERPKSQTGSIYNLIKKREENLQASEEKKVKFEDSFDDSDDDADKKIPRSATKRFNQQSSDDSDDFKKPEEPKRHEPVVSSVENEEFNNARLPEDLDDDDISLKGFVSEAVRRESILPSAPLGSSQSSLDSYDAAESEGSSGGPSSKQDGYGPDDESMDDEDEDETSNRNAVDDLLDEAMSDSTDDYDPDMDPRNVVLRRPQPNKETYDADMDPNNVQLRRKVNTAVPVPAQRHHKAAESTDDDDDRPYSLQAYRKSANVHQHVLQPIVRKSKYVDSYVEEDVVMPTTSEPQRDERRAVQERIKELQELVQQEQNVIMQASNALNKCCMGNSYFAGSPEQVECNKVLLIACQKRQCYMTEIQRLKETGTLSVDGPGPKGSLTISDIRLPLKKEFVTKIGTSQDNTTHYFILLFKNGPQIICTQMLSTHDPMMRGSLDFPNLIKINGITSNFKLVLDIYAMSVSREYTKDKKKKTPKKGKGYAMALESPGGPSAVRTTSFTQVSSLPLTMKCLDKNSFHLERLPYLSPLYGQIFLRLKCLMEASVEEKGFLTMFDDVSGLGAWHRRWCVLSGNKLCVWKYPDDETRKDPMTIIDLKRCITEKVGLVPRDICARPNTFEMVTVRQPLKGEHDTLVTKTYNTTTTVRHQMSADSKEERIIWCNKINKTLANLRTWNADALKPMKQSASSSYH